MAGKWCSCFDNRWRMHHVTPFPALWLQVGDCWRDVTRHLDTAHSFPPPPSYTAAGEIRRGKLRVISQLCWNWFIFAQDITKKVRHLSVPRPQYFSSDDCYSLRATWAKLSPFFEFGHTLPEILDLPLASNGHIQGKCPGLTWHCGTCINIAKPRFLYKTSDLWSYIDSSQNVGEICSQRSM